MERRHKNAPKTRNPRSEIGRINNTYGDREGRKVVIRVRSADYKCPICVNWMYTDEDIEFGTVALPGGGTKLGKYHRVCPKD